MTNRIFGNVLLMLDVTTCRPNSDWEWQERFYHAYHKDDLAGKCIGRVREVRKANGGGSNWFACPDSALTIGPWVSVADTSLMEAFLIPPDGFAAVSWSDVEEGDTVYIIGTHEGKGVAHGPHTVHSIKDCKLRNKRGHTFSEPHYLLVEVPTTIIVSVLTHGVYRVEGSMTVEETNQYLLDLPSFTDVGLMGEPFECGVFQGTALEALRALNGLSWTAVTA